MPKKKKKNEILNIEKSFRVKVFVINKNPIRVTKFRPK